MCVRFSDLIDMFGVEVVVLWVAMVLKKRVFVHADKIKDLLESVRYEFCFDAHAFRFKPSILEGVFPCWAVGIGKIGPS